MDAADYYKLRLEHTIQHLQQASRLIYFVSGAVVAGLYFVMEKIKDVPTQRNFTIGLLILLAVVNVVNGLLIEVQGRWYKLFDAELARSVGASVVTRKSWVGARGLYADVHWVVAAFALVAAAYLFCTGQ